MIRCKKYKSILLLLFIVLIVAGCSNVKETKLEVIDLLEVKHLSTDEGIRIDDASEQVVQFLVEESILKQDTFKHIQSEEYTINSMWDNDKIQLFAFKELNGSIDGIAIFINNELEHFIQGMPIEKIYLADLNEDNKYDICVNSYYGSGMINSLIQVYDIYNNMGYNIDLRKEEKDIKVEISANKKELEVYLKPMNTYEDEYHYVGNLGINDGEIDY